MENLNIKVFMNIGEASAFLEQECFHIPILMDITNAYKGTFGGCSCNRGRRVANANNVYKLTINNLEEKYVKFMKEALGVDKIIFKLSEAETIKEF